MLILSRNLLDPRTPHANARHVPYRELAELPAPEIFAEIERQDDGLRAQRWMLKLVVIELKHRIQRLEATCS